ncbi:DCC1-like thiol-disulfide oxidoreductase family protein [Streptomyces sp. NPDC006529]|uniref:thiol-disulfide oxidoreductase DCC family protein n=1 Tax=Streptomyces sp. NPDC006529 TaxID=3157177 RepID=UPI0033B2F5CF
MTADRPAGAPVRKLVVLYDARCALCVHIRNWLTTQRCLVPVALVPAGSLEARHRFPRLDHAATLREITVVGDRGQVWTGADAFIVALWALADHRPKANWLATAAGRPFARGTVLAAAAWRGAVRTTPGAGAEAVCDDQCAVPR